MAEEQLFDIVFTGDIAASFVLLEVKKKVAQRFKMDERKVDALFKGRAVTLKKNLDSTAAKKYQKILTQMGMVVLIQPRAKAVSAIQQANITSPENTRQDVLAPKAGDTNNDSRESSPDWALDEVGVLLSEPSPVMPNIASPNYTLTSPMGNILTPEEMPAPIAAPDDSALSDVTIKTAGQSLLDEAEKATVTEEPSVDLSHLSAETVGGDLLAENEKRKFVATDIDVSAIELADEKQVDS
jgi:hypothetical protein